MKKEDILTILLTFVMGLVAGGYLFLTQAKPFEEKMATPDAEAALDFVVIGEAYGSCGTECPQFWVTGNGSYRYIFADRDQGRELVEGVLSRTTRNALHRELLPPVLLEQSVPVPEQVCGNNDQGIDIRYRITIEGEEYRLDSCKSAVEFKSDLWQSLNRVWGELGSAHSTPQ